MFSINDYDNKGVLKPGIFLILIIVFTARFLLFGPLSLIARRGLRTSREVDMSFLTNVSPFEMLSSIPPVVILFLMLARGVNSPSWMKVVWMKGKEIMLATAAIQTGLYVLRLTTAETLLVSSVVVGVANLFLIYYFTFNARPKAVFSMFPSEPDEAERR